MRVFPQLGTGAMAMYPLTRRIHRRTVAATLADGRDDKYADPDGWIEAWEWRARGLTAAECAEIEGLHAASGGAFETFTFVDPTGNLLAESENFESSVWAKEGALTITAAVADPFGGARATRLQNAGQAVASLVQTLSVPGTFQYCFSVWVRSVEPLHVTLVLSAGGADVSATLAVESGWKRISVTGSPGREAETVRFQIQLAAAVTVEIFGAQAEGQLAPGGYAKTGDRGGVYSRARFDADSLQVTATGTDSFDAVVRIVNTER